MPADHPGEVPGLPGVDDGDRDAGLVEGGDEGRLVPAGGLQDDEPDAGQGGVPVRGVGHPDRRAGGTVSRWSLLMSMPAVVMGVSAGSGAPVLANADSGSVRLFGLGPEGVTGAAASLASGFGGPGVTGLPTPDVVLAG